MVAAGARVCRLRRLFKLHGAPAGEVHHRIGVVDDEAEFVVSSAGDVAGRLGVAVQREGVAERVTSAGWQVTLCDPMRHVSSRSGVATLRTVIHLLLTYITLHERFELKFSELKLTGVQSNLARGRIVATQLP